MSQGAKAMVLTTAQPGVAVAKGGIMNAQQQMQQQPPSFLGGLFNKRERKLSHSEESGATIVSTGSAPNNATYGRTTEV